jgi:hypothetical protein
MFNSDSTLRALAFLFMPVWLLLNACAADSPAPALDGLIEVASPAMGSAGEPNLMRARDGTIYLSWIELQPDSTHALRFATWKENALSPARTIASGARWFVNWADFPMMATLEDGTLAAHWLQRSANGRYTYDVLISTSRDGGQIWSAPIKPHRDTVLTEHGFVSLFALGDRFGAVWLDGRNHKGDGEGGAMTLRFTTFAPGGDLGEDLEIDDRVCDCCQTSVALTSEGPILVYRDRSADEIRDISVARYVNGQWTAGRAIRADNWHVEYCPVNGPSVAAQDGRVAVAWYTMANDSARVFVAFSTDAGATFTPGIRVDGGLPLGRVDVQLLEHGALVSWLESVGEADEKRAEIRVRRVHEDGQTSGLSTVSPASAERSGGFPQMAVSGDRVVFSWTEPGSPARLHVGSARLIR